MTTLAKPRLGPKMAALTDMQRRFVEEYLLNPSSATKAARLAGYSETTAPQMASELIHNPRIIEAMEEFRSASAERVGLTHDRILLELARIAFSNPGDIINLDPELLSEEQLKAIGVEVIIRQTQKGPVKDIKLKSVDKAPILQLLGKHLGMFRDKVEVSGSLSLEKLIEQSMQEDK